MSEEIKDEEMIDNEEVLIEEADDVMNEELSPAEERELDEALMLASEDSEDEAGLLPEASDEELDAKEDAVLSEAEFSGTELESYEGAEIEDVEFIETERLESIIESILFASDRPVSMASIRQVFQGTSVKKKQINQAIENLAVHFADARRGVSLEEVTSGFQLRTKIDNMDFLKKTIKGRPFKLSGPALEVLAIAAYKQPLVKIQIDEIRGVESGHLLRALMEKGLMSFAGKSELPGKPMLYQTTKKFLEIFGLRNLKELPSLSEIDNLLPEGIGDEEEKQTLSELTDGLSEGAVDSYSIGEEELGKISDQLSSIETSTDFFEDEKKRQKDKRDRDRATDIREALAMGETVEGKDQKWLERYDKAIEEAKMAAEAEVAAEVSASSNGEELSQDEATEVTAHLNHEAVAPDSEQIDEAEAQIRAAAVEEIVGIENAEPDDEPSHASPEEITQAAAVETDHEGATEVKAPPKKSKKGDPQEHAAVVNEKLARALAAFREGFSEDEAEQTDQDGRPTDSEI